jgi:hypothetical protein
MRGDLGAQRCEGLFEQRTHRHRQQNQLDKVVRGGAAVRGERR